MFAIVMKVMSIEVSKCFLTLFYFFLSFSSCLEAVVMLISDA